MIISSRKKRTKKNSLFLSLQTVEDVEENTQNLKLYMEGSSDSSVEELFDLPGLQYGLCVLEPPRPAPPIPPAPVAQQPPPPPPPPPAPSHLALHPPSPFAPPTPNLLKRKSSSSAAVATTARTSAAPDLIDLRSDSDTEETPPTKKSEVN